MKEDKIYSLCEAVADIAIIATNNNYYSGDSRQDIANFIMWAKEFEEIFSEEVWGINKEYMEEIEKFTLFKIGG